MSPFIPDSSNELFRLAASLVNESSRNIFLTGKAGTGKTTFLKFIRENCMKQMAVVAPTGVAAINAGGVTIHSFFQLPLSPFIPAGEGDEQAIDKHELIKRLRFNSEKIKILRQLELLVIDEISMVRCDTLDAIDAVLRHVRRRHHDAFGGIQVLFIGDMLQLPPVTRDEEWRMLSKFYQGPYFFNSHVITAEMPVYVEFEKIYRQTEEKFIGLLNQVRNNALEEDGFAILESRYLPQFQREKGDGFIVLTTHNEKARQINSNELNALPEDLFTYEARVEDDFSDRAFPADQKLELKTGAQVMFIRNDSSEKGKRYYNGKIGTVTRLENDKIYVNCGDAQGDIEVTKETWENIRYTLNPDTRSLEQKRLGSFTQYPLRLAWAITIHKSQGLTFDKAIIDAGAAFAPGQVYVALSRCTNLEGMILKTRINPSSLLSDQRLLTFTQHQAAAHELEKEFESARRKYHQEILFGLFGVEEILVIAKDIQLSFAEHRSTFNEEAFPWIGNIIEKLEALQETSRKFAGQLESIFNNPASGSLLNERLVAASSYFAKEFNAILKLLEFSPVVSDSYIQSREFVSDLVDIYGAIALKKQVVEKANLLNIEEIQGAKKNFKMPPFRVKAYAPDTDIQTEQLHPALFRKLKEIRDSICESDDLPVYLVASSNTLKELTRFLPQTPEELKKIKGFGKTRTEKYGSRFLEPIVDYTLEHGLSSMVHEKTPKKERKSSGVKKTKPGTKAETLRLFNEGKSLPEIAEERKLALSTIETHMIYFITNGEIPVESILNTGKLQRIRTAIEQYHGGSITELKNKIGDDISYNEIRMVSAVKGIRDETTNDRN